MSIIDEIKVIRLGMIDNTLSFGSGNWTEDIKVFVNNFRTEDGIIIADLSTKSEESYENRQGRTCYRHRNCGTIRLTREKCIINIDVDGEEELTCKPIDYIEDGKWYVKLDFNPAIEKQKKIQELVQSAQEYLDKHLCEEELELEDRCCEMASEPMPVESKCYSIGDELDPDLLETMQPTFSQKLFDLIKKKKMSETDCYKNANLDRRLFSKIRSDDEYQPSKNTVFALIFGLRLTLKDANELLDAAGYSISHSLKMDVLIEFMIKNRIYDIFTVNEILYKYGCQLLGNVAK